VSGRRFLALLLVLVALWAAVFLVAWLLNLWIASTL
jgi:hypothetical protein